MIGKELEHYVRHFAKRFLIFLKWLAFSILSGILVGSVGAVFHYCILYGTNAREKYPWLIFLLPAAGLLIVGVYHLMRNEEDTGTNLVLSAIHSGKHIPLRMAPLIFISTVMTHLFGGSAGREGAALQLGGSIGNSLGRFLKFDEKDQHIMIFCAFRHSSGCRGIFHGGSQRGNHALCSSGSLRGFLFSGTGNWGILPDCAGAVSAGFCAGVHNFFCSDNGPSCHSLRRCQRIILHCAAHGGGAL